MDVSHLLDGLNPAQREAVSAPPGHYLVLAGAGSGKTRVLTHRIAWLNEVLGVPVHGIFAVTFTNKAAGEMRHRADALLRNGSRGMWIGTFHGLAHRLLRLHWQEAKLPEGFQVLDSDDQLRLVKRVVQQLELDEARFPPRQIAWWINAQKDEGRRPQHIQPDGDEWSEAMLQQLCAVPGALRPRRAGRFRRDCCCARMNCCATTRRCSRITGSASANCWSTNSRTPTPSSTASCACSPATAGQVFVVGDDDQAIYGWRGAKVENVQHFLHDFPGAQTIRLEQNYRSSANILNAANAVIAHNPARIGKQLWTDSGDGEPIDLYAAYNEVDEARFVVERIRQWVRDGGSHGECAILYRSNAQSRAFEEALLAEQIPYRVYGGMRFFERAEIKDTLAYLRLVDQPRRRCGVRARGQHADARHRRAHAGRSAQARAQRWRVAVGGARSASRASNGLAGARAQCAGRVPGAGRCARRRSRGAAAQGQDRPRAGALGPARALRQRIARAQLDSRIDNLDELVSVASRFVRRDDEEAGGADRAGRLPRLRRARGRRRPGRRPARTACS